MWKKAIIDLLGFYFYMLKVNWLIKHLNWIKYFIAFKIINYYKLSKLHPIDQQDSKKDNPARCCVALFDFLKTSVYDQ